MPVRVVATAGSVADCTEACGLIEGLSAEHLIADKGYDSNAIVEQAAMQGMHAQIPPRKNRKDARDYDKHLYRHRHLVENAFLHIKQWRGMLLVTPRTWPHSWRLSKFVVWCYGCESRDDML
jgi:transposase